MSKGLYIEVPEEFEFRDLLKLVQDSTQSAVPKDAKVRIGFNTDSEGFTISVFPGKDDAQSAFSNKGKEEVKPKPKPKKRAPKKKTEAKAESE